MKKCILFIGLFLVTINIFSQDQIIYQNNNEEYVDSIVGIKDDSLFYYNFKKEYKLALKNVKGYYETLRTKENLKKGYYQRSREYYNTKKDSVFSNNTGLNNIRDYVAKINIPLKGNGEYNVIIGVEKSFRKEISFLLDYNLLIINDSKNSNRWEIKDPTVNNYIENGFGTSLIIGGRFYAIPFRLTKPSGIYIGFNAQPLYFRSETEVKYILNNEFNITII